MTHAWLSALLGLVLLVLHPGTGCAAEGGAARLDAKAEVAAVLYAASATQAALAKSLYAQLRGQQERISSLAVELKTGNARHRGEMIAAQETFVAQLAAKDREYAVQIDSFRATVTDIASTPEGAGALGRFNAGDEVGAIAILDRLRAANERMRETHAKLQDAAEGRRIAQLAVEALTRGKVTTQAVITRFEDVVRLDPGEVADWLELSRLYQDTARLADANSAVDSLFAATKNDRDRAIGFNERTDVLLTQGDLPGARRAADQGLAISRRLLAADPKNYDLQKILSRQLLSFGLVARRQGDLAAAQKSYEEEITLARRKIAADPADPGKRNSLSADLLHLADVFYQRGDLPGARRAIEESLGFLREIAAGAPDNVVYPRHIDVTLMWLSDVLVAQGAFVDARKANAEIIATASKLSAADPSNAVLRRDLGFGYSKTGLLQRIEGDFDGALDSYQRALAIFRELARAPSAGRDMRGDVGTGLSDLCDLLLVRHEFAAAQAAARESVAALRTLAAADATDVSSRQFLAYALYDDAAASIAEHDLNAAHTSLEEGLAIDKALAAKNSDDAPIQYDMSAGYLELGRLMSARGDHAGALAALQRSLQIRRAFADSHLGNSTAQRGLAECMRELIDQPGSKIGWPEFLAQVEAMDRNGIVWPADKAWLEEARRHAATENS